MYVSLTDTLMASNATPDYIERNSYREGLRICSLV